MDSSLLLSRAEDAVRLCDARNYPHFLGFLDQGERMTVSQYLQKCDADWMFYGGHEDAERCFLGVFPSYMEPAAQEFPIEAVALHYRTERDLTHRDVLGTLMSVGLRREAIGDILCGEGISVVFLKDDVISYVCEQVDKVGGEGVRIEREYCGPLPHMHSFLPITDTVASARIDAVVKALIHCSREQAATLIRSEAVQLDHQPVTSVSAAVSPGAIVSVRGHGRFVIDELGPETQKGRLHFSGRKYV